MRNDTHTNTAAECKGWQRDAAADYAAAIAARLDVIHDRKPARWSQDKAANVFAAEAAAKARHARRMLLALLSAEPEQRTAPALAIAAE